MNRRTNGLMVASALMLALVAAGILFHKLSGYSYPAPTATGAYELNTLGDLFELGFSIPVGLIGLWLIARRSAWGPVLVAGVAANFVYNYLMALTGVQNLWTFFWTVKVSLSALVVILAWDHLPSAEGTRPGPRLAISGYLLLIALIFGKMMAQRLLASADGFTVDMAMVRLGPVDWRDPAVRDPIVFFTLAIPMMPTAVVGLLRGSAWGAKAATLCSTFLVCIVTLVIVTGPIKEILEKGATSMAMISMSGIMVAAVLPAVASLIWLTRGEAKASRTAGKAA
ncbi:MAG: hypothetical protein K0R39_4773 [Symbiobacteriaceae bacterium]|nr:hypothetical protein [Symbiobacteriaceae bacterium]